MTCTDRHGVDDGVAALLGAQGAAGGVFELPGAVGVDLFRLTITITLAPADTSSVVKHHQRAVHRLPHARCVFSSMNFMTAR
ncbi:hypothetical protein CD932_02905 [Janthinobacterium sp. PC23-8]|nr:hypothetical protein CD932_02905 [Janthinobacterium sp. PC23-8]